MKKRLVSAVLALLLAANGAAFGVQARERNAVPNDSLSAYENGQVLAMYEDGTVETFVFADERSLAEGLERLERDERVVLLQPNYTYQNTALSVSDELAGQQWALFNDGSFQMDEKNERLPFRSNPFVPDRWNMRPFSDSRQTAAQEVTAAAGIDVNAEEAWAVYDGGSRQTVVAVIDTGVDYAHEDLAHAIWVNEDEIAGNGVDDDGNGYVDDVNGWNFYDNNNRIYVNADHDSHGTHGAGTIAAAADNGTGIAGIVQSENVTVMVLKVLGGADGSGSTESIIKAIRYAQDNGADICNLSLGSSNDDRALYQTIAGSSMLFVAAAGNDGADTDAAPCYPASYELDNVISVGNLNYDGTLHESSNRGAKTVDLAAPGTYILSTTPENGYSYMSGTSMAAPMVTAAAAMLYSHYDDATLADVKDILLASVKTLDALDGVTVTGGMLDLGAAMSRGTDGLSGREWDVSEAAEAPIVEVQVSGRNGTTCVYVQVTDDDLVLTAYAPGTLTARDFAHGTNGVVFETDENGTAMFTASSSGTYTFYALDARGNETVQTVTVRVQSPGNMQPLPPMRSGGWGFGPPSRHPMNGHRFER